MAQRIDYDSFGTVTSDTNEGFTPFGFAGGLYDPTTGLVRFGARDYDANAARWTAKDPAGFAGGDTSLYAYAGGDPVNFVDTSGLGFKLPGFIHIALDVVGVIPVIGDAVDLVHAGLYLAEGDCLNAALSLAAVIPIAGSAALGARYALKYGDEAVALGRGARRLDWADETGSIGRRFTDDQEALVDLAKKGKQAGGVSPDDARVLTDWADEYGLAGRGPEIHPGGGGWASQNPHIHIGPVNHIPVL